LQTLLGKNCSFRATCLLSGDEFERRKEEFLKAFSKDALKLYLGPTIEIVQKYAARWISSGQVDMAGELEDMSFDIAAKCLIGAHDPGHVQKLRTIMGGASLFDTNLDPVVSAGVRDAVLEKIDEELEHDMVIAGHDAEATNALDILIEGGLDMEEMKIDLLHYLFKGRDCLARELKALMLSFCKEAATRKVVEDEINQTAAPTIDFEIAGGMVATRRVLKEVRRMYPINPMPWRVLTQDISVGETLIHAGTRVCLAYHETHQDGTQYTEPAKWDPERFSQDRAEDKKNSGWCYIPYGTGVLGKVDRCPADAWFAQVAKVFAFVLTKKCQWNVVEGQDLTPSGIGQTFDRALLMDIKSK